MSGLSRKVQIGDCTMIRGDCLSVLPRLEAGSVDAVVTDPPYGIKCCNRSDGGVGSVSSGSKVYGRQTWDFRPVSPNALAEILALDVPTVIWGGNYFALPPSRCVLVWNKMQRKFSFADGELAWTNLDKALRIFDYSRGQLALDGKQHPAQKPVALMRWCLDLLKVKPGKTVLDPFMGSGTTAVACLQTGRRFIGVELDPQYFKIACKRVREAQKVAA